jgi:hypothetical protein
MMKDTEPEDMVFSKNETFGISEGLDDFDDFDIGPQIDEFDNSLDFDFEDNSTETLWVAENLNSGEIVAACWADSEDLAHRLLSQALRERASGDLRDCYIREAEDDEFDYVNDNPDLLAEACERKPIPEGMTIKQLVEEMEENEDTVECVLCQDLFDKSTCRKELNLGWLCRRCADDLVARGEGPVFKEDNYWDFLDEDIDLGNFTIEDDYVYLEYEDLDDYVYKADKADVALELLETMTEEDLLDFPGGMAAFDELDNEAQYEYAYKHMERLLTKYEDKILNYFRNFAIDALESEEDEAEPGYNSVGRDGFRDYNDFCRWRNS